MNIEQDFLTTMSELNHDPHSSHPDVQTIISLIDLTILDKTADETTLNTLQTQLNTDPVAAVCVS